MNIDARAKNPMTASSIENQNIGFLHLSTKGAKAMLPIPMPTRKVASIIVNA